MRALTAFADQEPAITIQSDTVIRIDRRGANPRVELSSGGSIESNHVVVAGGAWSSLIEGVRLTGVTPVRGQLIAYGGIGLRHVVYGPRGYLVPRVNVQTLAGSTMESVGFDSTTTVDGVDRIRSASEEIAPALSVMPIQNSWAGLRPVTPDLLPILGPDSEAPNIIYACGHSRNGILLAPLTGDVVAAILVGEPVLHDLSQFRPERFQDRLTRP